MTTHGSIGKCWDCADARAQPKIREEPLFSAVASVLHAHRGTHLVEGGLGYFVGTTVAIVQNVAN